MANRRSSYKSAPRQHFDCSNGYDNRVCRRGIRSCSWTARVRRGVGGPLLLHSRRVRRAAPRQRPQLRHKNRLQRPLRRSPLRTPAAHMRRRPISPPHRPRVPRLPRKRHNSHGQHAGRSGHNGAGNGGQTRGKRRPDNPRLDRRANVRRDRAANPAIRNERNKQHTTTPNGNNRVFALVYSDE